MSKPKRPQRRNRRPRVGWLLLAGALLLGAAALLSWRGSPPASTSPGAPDLTVDKEKVDLGEVRLGQTVSVVFELTNTGEAPLRFREAPYIEVVEGC